MSVSGGVDTWVFSDQDLHDGQVRFCFNCSIVAIFQQNIRNKEPFLKWLQIVGNTSDAQVPKVISVSYGDDENSISASYLARCEVEFMKVTFVFVFFFCVFTFASPIYYLTNIDIVINRAKVGIRGISLLFAAGDSGADCRSSGQQFNPDWPASSPRS